MRMLQGRHFGLYAGTVCTNRFSVLNLHGRRTNSARVDGMLPETSTGGPGRKRTRLGTGAGQKYTRSRMYCVASLAGVLGYANTASRR